jgi:hypothetical protein
MERAAEAEAEASASSKPREIDDSIEQVALFMQKSGSGAAEAWNMPLGEIVWYNVCFLRQDGADLPIWTPRDEEAFELNKIERYKRIAAKANEIRGEYPGASESLILAHAAARYWEDVVAVQRKYDG